MHCSKNVVVLQRETRGVMFATHPKGLFHVLEGFMQVATLKDM